MCHHIASPASNSYNTSIVKTSELEGVAAASGARGEAVWFLGGVPLLPLCMPPLPAWSWRCAAADHHDAALAPPVVAPDAVIIDLRCSAIAGFGSLPRAVLCEVCKFSLCLCGFSPATLTFSNYPLTRAIGNFQRSAAVSLQVV